MSKVFLTDSVNTTVRMHECGQNEYWFYHKGTYPNDNPLLYQQLIDNATNEIIIWDPYFNVKFPNRDQDIFANIKDDITIKILALKGLDGPRTYFTEIKNALKTIIPPVKNSRFGLRVINKGEPLQALNKFHDRFLIIDNSEVYLIGASVGYHIHEEQSTGFFKVSNNDTKDFIKSIFKHYWDSSTLFQIPLTYLHV